jgi:hypothetical protein
MSRIETDLPIIAPNAGTVFKLRSASAGGGLHAGT